MVVYIVRRGNQPPLVTKGMGGSEETFAWRETYNRRMAESMRRAGGCSGVGWGGVALGWVWAWVLGETKGAGGGCRS